MPRAMSKYGTPFLETEAILASQADDKDHLRTLLSQLLPSELKELENAAGDLEDLAHQFRMYGNFLETG